MSRAQRAFDRTSLRWALVACAWMESDSWWMRWSGYALATALTVLAIAFYFLFGFLAIVGVSVEPRR